MPIGCPFHGMRFVPLKDGEEHCPPAGHANVDHRHCLVYVRREEWDSIRAALVAMRIPVEVKS